MPRMKLTMTIKLHQIKNITTKITVILGVLAVGSIFMQTAHATHYYSGNRWLGSSIDLCYDSNSLGLMNIGATAAMSELDVARTNWNNQPSVFTLNKISPGGFCHNWNTSAAYGKNGVLATTFTSLTGSTITDTDTEYNRSYSWTTSSNCSPEPYTMHFTALHEFGHWVKFNHAPSSENSVMVPAYNCVKDSAVQSHDSSSLTTIYG